jgi:hypothetical protein
MGSAASKTTQKAPTHHYLSTFFPQPGFGSTLPNTALIRHKNDFQKPQSVVYTFCKQLLPPVPLQLSMELS